MKSVVDWGAVLQWLGGAAFLTLVGIGLRAVFTERGTVMASLLDDVKSLRADGLANDQKFQDVSDKLEKARSDLQECRDGRAELSRQLNDYRQKLDTLEAKIKKYSGQEAT